jgi:hypothetical protein
MADTHFLSSVPTLVLGGTVAASYTWLALRRVTGDLEVNAAMAETTRALDLLATRLEKRG